MTNILYLDGLIQKLLLLQGGRSFAWTGIGVTSGMIDIVVKLTLNESNK